jgi:glutamyl-tRNA synthetase
MHYGVFTATICALRGHGSGKAIRYRAMTTSLSHDAVPPEGTSKPLVVGRLAPTPSGRMHLGNAFSALVAWASARSQGGRVILRIEDLDPRAQDPENSRMLVDDLCWLGIDWDEGPIYQSARADVYLQEIDHLTRQELTYPCFCTRSELHAATAPHASDGTYLYPGTCRGLSPQEVAERSRKRRPATRLMVPPGDDPRGTIRFEDLGYGKHEECLARECGDFLIRRSDGVVAYQLAVVVDDCQMGVTEVVRGRDLLPSSARQIYLARLLGMTPPRYGHVPLLIAPGGRRLSKRDHDLSLQALREENVSPKAVVGLLASYIGLAEGGDEIDAAEFERRFSWDAIRSHRVDIQADASALLSG